jgi:hypothetical protein
MIMTMSRRNVLIDGATAAAMSVAGSESPEDAQSRIGGTKRSLDIIIIIVGGGSAAAVLAAGLNTDVQRRVLLLEAGQNFKPNSYPSAITDANVVAAPAFNWHYQADDHVRRSPDIPVPRGTDAVLRVGPASRCFRLQAMENAPSGKDASTVAAALSRFASARRRRTPVDVGLR